MSRIKPRNPRGFRDFMPDQMLKREFVFNTVRRVFELHGFEPIHTPVLELNETLYGKYGEDAESLIFSAKHNRSEKDELSMRYDLTVPLARVVAQYENELNFPFKRYHIAPVFRGERPQKGRYREFYQCDADIVGVSGADADAEIISLNVMALRELGFSDFTVKVNSRKLLTGMGIYSGVPDEQLPDLYRSVDKFDKVGAEGVEKELVERGIASDVVKRMMELIQSREPGVANLDVVDQRMGGIEAAAEAITELRQVAEYLDLLGVPSENYEFDFTVVRGLGYYTGPIFEAVITEPNLGSISGGGRYDELIGLFRKQSLPTVGTSLGIERITDLMDILDLYPANVGGTVVQIFITVFNDETRGESVKLAAELRAAGINAEVNMEGKKLGKQFGHADKKQIPLVAVMGPDEVAAGKVSVKRLADGHEVQVDRTQVASTIADLL